MNSCIFGVYLYRCENDRILTLFDEEIMSLDESEGKINESIFRQLLL